MLLSLAVPCRRAGAVAQIRRSRASALPGAAICDTARSGSVRRAPRTHVHGTRSAGGPR